MPNVHLLILVDMAAYNAILAELSTSQKLDGSNYDMWKRKIQYLLEGLDLLDHLTVAKFPPSEKDKDGKPIDTSSVQYQESLRAYEDWAKKDRRACFTMLCCMHDDLIGEFEDYPTAKDMWDQLKVRFGQTSETRLRTLQLKWMNYKMDSSRTVVEHLRIMSGIVRDLKAAGKDISEGEQVLNVIRALPDAPPHWEQVKTVLTHSDHLKTFGQIQSHLEMEEERLKMFGTPNVALVAKVNRPQGNKNTRGRQYKQSSRPPQKGRPKAGSSKKPKAKGNGR